MAAPTLVFANGELEEAETLDGKELENEVYLSHVIPAAPVVLSIGDRLPKEDCDADDLPEVSAPVILSWAAVTTAHEELGKATGSELADHGISVTYYEVVIEIDESPFKATIIVPSDVTSVELPEAITDLVDETEE